jgi:hypothetical protein
LLICRYAEAATKGAGNVEGVPIENNNVTEDVIEKAEEALHGSKKSKVTKAIEDEIDLIGKELKDPAVSSSIVVTLLASSGAVYYLNNQHRLGKLTWPVTACVAAGVAVVGAVEFLVVKKYCPASKNL